jgi:hypothetical protein
LTAQGHPRRIFATAIERGNIVMAEATARELELGRISLEEALALTALVAEKEPERRSRFAVRWLRRLLEEDVTLTIEEAVVTGSCLSALEAVVISNDSDLVTPIKLVREELKLPVGDRQSARSAQLGTAPGIDLPSEDPPGAS